MAQDGACLVVAIVLSKPLFTAVLPQASLLPFSSSAGILEQLFLRLLFHFGSMYIDCILLPGLNLMSHTCRGEGSLSKKEYLVVVQVLDKMHKKAQDSKLYVKQARKVCSFLDTMKAKCFWLHPKCYCRFLENCVLCPDPRAHLHLLLTRQTCLKPVGVSFCAGKLISQYSGKHLFFNFLRLVFRLIPYPVQHDQKQLCFSAQMLLLFFANESSSPGTT